MQIFLGSSKTLTNPIELSIKAKQNLLKISHTSLLVFKYIYFYILNPMFIHYYRTSLLIDNCIYRSVIANTSVTYSNKSRRRSSQIPDYSWVSPRVDTNLTNSRRDALRKRVLKKRLNDWNCCNNSMKTNDDDQPLGMTSQYYTKISQHILL